MITKDMIMGEIVSNYEGAAAALMSIGMGCISCPASLSESLESAALVHGKDADEVTAYLNQQLGLK
ncbi:DUF1858 domain-containing protein [Oribacterium sp. WCC10]|uniref:DUF1858 domain-containing protein n=1 Tax=Oribacterium sp. WCC10 TaxID=1855343 RepID=UPI0008E2276E|nr:DUF1858 domain-containing protein [Oribacterium sp. WCC10]SFG16186.1 hybrid cluster protein-associated redox disulfide domain-containing protein [Oribacterium sp. WCC10]